MVQGQPEPPRGAQGVDRWMPLALVLLFILALAGGVALLVQRGDASAVEVALPQPTAVPTPIILKAYVAGAVRSPDLYTFSDGDRLKDLLDMAGGLAENADKSRLNLAIRLQDETSYYVPYVPTLEETPVATALRGVAVMDGLVVTYGDGVINLNIATAREMETLPGIGPTRAQAIVEFREGVGGFNKVDDLLLVPGIGQATLDKIRDRVRVR